MQKKKHFQTRKILADTLVIVLLALVLMPLHSWIFGTSLLDNPDNAKASVSELAYRIQRQQTEATQSDEISLVDISGLYGSSSRGDIAALLDSIYDMNPKSIQSMTRCWLGLPPESPTRPCLCASWTLSTWSSISSNIASTRSSILSRDIARATPT